MFHPDTPAELLQTPSQDSSRGGGGGGGGGSGSAGEERVGPGAGVDDSADDQGQWEDLVGWFEQARACPCCNGGFDD